ncbi:MULTISPECIES: hypothetical protein [Mycolicibacter]|uniref:HNH endonuclease n=2 Tax=Mycolicibacter TaxID=1073531 RepID=A0ABU5XP30_9MYCO|nr:MULTISPECIES: hypothetical protein [unclassified Mycolicibacter]MEB3023057.1 hypothetical protein [Mycolicibacter sp. MYC098]MEB3033567.1 hypothetical protein [Mycolicibacter sp. MYC340]
MIAHYTDGSVVQPGDRVRYHQTPGGLMSPETELDGSIKWHYGTAKPHPRHQERRVEMLAAYEQEDWRQDPDELYCHGDDGRWYHMAPHIIERVE